MDIQQVLDLLPDKWECKTTTTKQFKYDLYSFCIENNIKSALEIGASVGHTTFFLANFLERITSVEINPGKIKDAKKRTVNFSNIKFLEESVYGKEWEYEPHDLVIIDCIHDYTHVISDIKNALKIKSKYLVFDDYGLFPEVKRAIDDCIKQGLIKEIVKIGHKPGSHFSMARDPKVTKDKKLVDFEGIVCRVIG